MGRGRKLETIKDFERSINKGYGIGNEENYLPWLRVQDVSSHGKSSVIKGLKVQRAHHLLSKAEQYFFYQCEFADDVIDIREQFPLLPLTLSKKLASSLGINHPKHPKSKEDIILTTDFLITKNINNCKSYEAISVKSDTKSLSNSRTLEKLDLERSWWLSLGISFQLYIPDLTSETISENLAWITSPLRQGNIYDKTDLLNVLSLLNKGCHSIEILCESISLETKIDPIDTLNIIKTLAAQKYITIDLESNIQSNGVLTIESIVTKKS